MMLASRLVELIQHKAHVLGKRWSREVLENPLTPSYGRMEETELRRRAENVYASLGHWLDHSISRDEAKERYFQLGARRYTEGFEILEMVVGLSLEKSILMDVLAEESLFSNPLEMHGVIELMAAIMDFFDRALVYAVQGYETERRQGIQITPGTVRPTRVWFAIPEKPE